MKKKAGRKARTAAPASATRRPRATSSARHRPKSSGEHSFSALDRDWRYTHVNDRVAELAGWPKEKMIGRVIWEVFPEAVGTEFYEQCQRVMQTGEPGHGEFFYAPWNRMLDTRIYPTTDGIVIFRADITERKRHEELAREREAKLKESQDRLRLATEAADIGTFDFYPKTGELQFSDRSRELFGIPPEADDLRDLSRGRASGRSPHCPRDGPAGAAAGKHRPLRYRIPHHRNPGRQRTMGGRARPRRPRSIGRSDAIHRDDARHHRREECRNPFAAREERGGRGQPGEGPISRHALARAAHTAYSRADDDRLAAPRSESDRRPPPRSRGAPAQRRARGAAHRRSARSHPDRARQTRIAQRRRGRPRHDRSRAQYFRGRSLREKNIR